MRSILSRSAIAAIALSFSLFLCGTAVYSQPKIEFDELTHDWGEASEGDTITHAFRFKNTGDATLKIERVKSS